VVARHPSRDELVEGLIRVSEQELTGENEAGVDAYFAPDFAFHGPDGAELDYEGLKRYFASLRAAFDDLSIAAGSWLSRAIHRVPDDYHGNLGWALKAAEQRSPWAQEPRRAPSSLSQPRQGESAKERSNVRACSLGYLPPPIGIPSNK
jgi:hypothetical protein